MNTTARDPAADEATRRLADVFSPKLIDQLLAGVETGASLFDGVDGLLNRMTKAVLERAPTRAKLVVMPMEVRDARRAR